MKTTFITIEIETRTKIGKYGNLYTETNYVVWHPNGFQAFSNYGNAREYFNELTGN